jgi:phosphatidate cytidylyltransferase
MLKQRVITAIVLALIVVSTILLLDSFYVSILFAFIMFISVYELANMTIPENKPFQWLVSFTLPGLFFLSLAEMGSRALEYHSMLGLVLWGLVFLLMFGYQYSGQWSKSRRILTFIFATVLIWVCVHGLMFIHKHYAEGGWILMYVLTLVWVADIGAYFSGKKFGRHKLAPGISPGKTIEGVVGGLALNAVWISFVFMITQGWGLSYIPFLLLGLVTTAVSVVGDLFESILKREAGLKDSGKILPGHGGVLDRIDSVIAATPVYLGGLFMLGAV